MKQLKTFEVSRPSNSEKSLATLLDEQVNAWLAEKERQAVALAREGIVIHEMSQTLVAREQFSTVVLLSILYSER